MHIELTTEEQTVLGELIDHTLREMAVEVRRTDSLEYKEMLQERKHVLELLKPKLQNPTMAA